MANTSIAQFTGMFPKFQHNVIPDGAAQLLVDGEVMSGGLTAIRQNTPVLLLDRLYKDMYRYHTPRGAHQQWLLFDKPVDLVRTPVMDDATNMMFITGLGPMRAFDSYTLKRTDTTISEENSVVAAIPIPMAPYVTTSTAGKAETKKSVSYVIAYARTWRVSQKLDVGPASLPARSSALNAYVDVDTTKCAFLDNIKMPEDAALYNIDTFIIYRSAVTSEGTGSYREVCRWKTSGGSIPPGVKYNESLDTYSFLDQVPDLALGATLNHTNWSAPEELAGIISLRNGILAAFNNNTVYLSEPYQGHAWPSDYAIVFDYPVVGLGSFGNTLVVLTKANSYMCAVTSPANAILIPLQEAQSCVSKESIVNFPNCVVYASQYGLVRVNSNGAAVLTDKTIGPREWCRYNPRTMIAANYQGRYLAFFDSDQFSYKGFIYNFPSDYAMYTGSDTNSTGLIGLSQKPSCMWHDDAGNDVFVQYPRSDTGQPAIWNFGNTRSLGHVYTWVSKKFLNNYGLTSISAIKINFQDDSNTIVDINVYTRAGRNPFNSHQVNIFAINGDDSTYGYNIVRTGSHMCKVTFYGDDKEYFTFDVKDHEPKRVPAGHRFDSWYVKIVSSEPVARVQFATSIGELE